MRGIKDIKTVGRLGAGLLAGLAAGASSGQQSELPGPDLFLDVRTGLVVSDNFDRVEDPDGTSTVLQTDVVLGFDSTTKFQDLSIRLGTQVEFGNVADDIDFEQGNSEPFLTVAYALSNKTSELTFDGSIRETDNGFQTVEDQVSGDDLVIDRGTRRDVTAVVGFETGMEGPVGFTGQLSYGSTTYSGTSNTDLNDVERMGAQLGLRLALNRATDLRFSARYNVRDEDDASQTRETDLSYGVGVDVQIDPSLRLSADLNHAVNEVETTTNGIETTTRQEGPTFTFGLDKTVKNGTYGVQLSSSLTSSGTLTTLQFSRNLALRSGALEAMIGATWTDDEDIYLIGRISGAQELKTGTIRGLLEQSVRTSDDDADELITRASVSYAHRLTQISDLSLSANFTSADNLSDSGVDRQQTSLSVAYNHALTRDWNLQTGITHSVSSASDRGDITENRLFATIGRRFSLRP